MASDARLVTGQFDFSGGIDSSKVPLIQSAQNPQGLGNNQLAWLTNGTVRGGGILTRTGFQPLAKLGFIGQLYQGGFLYDQSPLNGGNPYLMLSIGGRMIQVRVDTDNSINDVTGAFSDPPLAPQAYFIQAEQFLVKQAGDGSTLPLFWDGNTLTRSVGIISPNNVPGDPPLGVMPFNELPPATSMCYYMGRIWYAQNRLYSAGDIVNDQASGTAGYQYTDSVIKVTENPLAIGGDGFTIPAQAGNIRAINYPISLDQTLGQGPLFIFTTKQIYSLQVPVTRADWIAATANNQPLQSLVMNGNGTVSERSVVAVNGDLFYQSLDPAIRSFFMALRYFQTWGNTPISNNINRILQFNDRSKMHVASGIEFNSRMLQTVLPIQTSAGIAFQSIAVMDLDPLSTLQNQNPPVWEGDYEGLQVLQLFRGDFGGLERAFAVTVSQIDGSIEVWELTNADRTDNAALSPISTPDKRVEMSFETPAFDWSEYPRAVGGGPFEYKELDGLQVWIDKLFGEAIIQVEFRPGEDACWYPWDTIKICAAQTSCEDKKNPVCYPLVGFREQYRNPLSFPHPTNTDCQIGNKIPITISTKFQLRFTITGWCRVRGFYIYAIHRESAPFINMLCEGAGPAGIP